MKLDGTYEMQDNPIIMIPFIGNIVDGFGDLVVCCLLHLVCSMISNLGLDRHYRFVDVHYEKKLVA